eukprot:scaffold1248_cov393-Prasinococcus_capsulatus_cf.AAC.24
MGSRCFVEFTLTDSVCCNARDNHLCEAGEKVLKVGRRAMQESAISPGPACNASYSVCLCGNALHAVNLEGYVALAAFFFCCLNKVIYDQWASLAVRNELKRSDDMTAHIGAGTGGVL